MLQWWLKMSNPLWASDVIWWETSRSTLVQVMVCRLNNTKPLLESTLAFCHMSPKKKSVEFESNYTRFYWRKRVIKCLYLTHWSRLTHICVSKQTIIGSDNGLSPGQRQAIIWTNVSILLIGTLGTMFSEILIEIRIYSFKKMDFKVSSSKCRPQCVKPTQHWMYWIRLSICEAVRQFATNHYTIVSPWALV